MNTALVIIDVQQSLVDAGVWNASEIIEKINQLITAAEREQAPVILVKDSRVKPDGAFHQSLKQSPEQIVIEKDYCDAFMGTSLSDYLTKKNIKQLVIAGMQSDFCIDTTSRQAAALGYEVLLVSDAHSTLDHEHLKAEQIVAHHNRILRSFNTAKGQVRLSETANILFK